MSNPSHQDAAQARAKADALARAYERVTWFRFSLVFIPIPFVVVLLRLDLESWHYYIAGAAYLGFSALLYTIDSRASAECDAAEKAAVALEEKLSLSESPHAPRPR